MCVSGRACAASSLSYLSVLCLVGQPPVFHMQCMRPHVHPTPTPVCVCVAGRTSAASSLSYLDNGAVFIGSAQGDSQLVRLHAQPPAPSDPNNYVEVRTMMA